MTTITTQPTTNYTTNTSYSNGGVQTNADVTDTSSVAGSGGENNVEQGSLSGPSAAGEADYDTASDLLTQILTGNSSTDWGALTDSVASANLSVTVTAIMVLLIEIMSQMKQDAREAALQQAQAAHTQGNVAADQMEVAAQATLTAAQMNAGMQIAMGALSVVGGAIQGAKLYQFHTQQSALTAKNNMLLDLTEGQATVAPPLDFAALSSSLQSANQLLSGLSGLGNSIMSLITADLTFDASIAEADAQRARAEGDYQQALGQNEQTFMQQLADAIRALLSGWGSIEQSTHEAYGATYRA
jgi:hypothetical protein